MNKGQCLKEVPLNFTALLLNKLMCAIDQELNGSKASKMYLGAFISALHAIYITLRQGLVHVATALEHVARPIILM